MDLCIVEQNDDAPAGLLAEWAEERGHRTITLHAAEIGAGPWPDPTGYGAVIPLGAEQSVERSPDPWIAPQVAFLREAHDRGVPVLGLCFGGQALAAALGGAVHRAATPEIGWLELESLDSAAIAPGPWFAWHNDTFTLPPGAGDAPLGLECDTDRRVSMRSERPMADLHELTAWALDRDVELSDLEIRRPTLEDIYLELTR